MFGSICLSELNEQAKKGNKAFSRGQNGKIYVNINVWINDTQDQYGNDASVKISTPKDEVDEKIYIGNLKFSLLKGNEPLTPESITDLVDEDILPF